MWHVICLLSYTIKTHVVRNSSSSVPPKTLNTSPSVIKHVWYFVSRVDNDKDGKWSLQNVTARHLICWLHKRINQAAWSAWMSAKHHFINILFTKIFQPCHLSIVSSVQRRSSFCVKEPPRALAWQPPPVSLCVCEKRLDKGHITGTRQCHASGKVSRARMGLTATASCFEARD